MNVTEAIRRISQGVLRRREGGISARRSGRFLIVGLTRADVTTATARGVAATIYDDSEAFVRFDLSEFGEKYTITRLIGFTGGLVCAWKEGELTGSIARRPAQVILFDQLEKAHPAFFQLMDMMMRGETFYEVIDGVGCNVSLEDSVIVMTTDGSIPRTSAILDQLLGRLDDVIDFQHPSDLLR